MEMSDLFVKENCILSLNQLAKARLTKRETYDTLIYHGFSDQGTATRGQQPALVVHTLVADVIQISTKGRGFAINQRVGQILQEELFFFSIPLRLFFPLDPAHLPQLPWLPRCRS